MVAPSTKHKAVVFLCGLICPICKKYLTWEIGLKYRCCKCGARFLHDLVVGELLRLPDRRDEVRS